MRIRRKDKDIMLPVLTDWNCQLLPDMHGSIARTEQALDVLSFLAQRDGFRRFYAMPTFDATEQSVAHFLLERARAVDALSTCLPRGLHLEAYARVLLSKELYETKSLSKLSLAGTGYLPILLPIGPYEDWMDLELNHLLYKAKMKLLITSFELYPILYPEEVVGRLLRIEGAAYQFNYRVLADKNHCRRIAQLLMHGKTVLLGTGINSHGQASRYETSYYLSAGEKNLTPVLFSRLIQQNTCFPKIIE